MALASISDGDTVEDIQFPGPIHGVYYGMAVFVFTSFESRVQRWGEGRNEGWCEPEVYMIAGVGSTSSVMNMCHISVATARELEIKSG
jgi:hypothetical protein